MPQVIRNFNDPNHAVTLKGVNVKRESAIFIPSYRKVLPVLPQSMHFIFRDASNPRGSTLFCTCGSAGIIVGYHAYKKYQSFMGDEVLACHHFIQYGRHADGSSE